MQDVVQAADEGDYEAALNHLNTLMEADDPRAWDLILYLFQSGDWGFEADEETAQELIFRGLDQGSPLAHYYTALLLSPGPFSKDRPAPPAEYLNHLQTAAEGGHQNAQHILAQEYRHQKQFQESYKWFEAAANNGDAMAKAMTIIIEEVEHYPTTSNPNRLLEAVSIGHPYIYEALAAFYQFSPHATRQDKSLALTYARLSEYFGHPYRQK